MTRLWLSCFQIYCLWKTPVKLVENFICGYAIDLDIEGKNPMCYKDQLSTQYHCCFCDMHEKEISKPLQLKGPKIYHRVLGHTYQQIDQLNICYRVFTNTYHQTDGREDRQFLCTWILCDIKKFFFLTLLFFAMLSLQRER